MIKENIPPVEEVRELVPEENKRLTPKQKKENQEYILNNLDKYIIDVHGNFFHTDEDMMMNEDEMLYIYKEAVEDYDKIKERIVKKIIDEKGNWEIIGERNEKNYRTKDNSKKIMFSAGFSPEQNDQIRQSLEGESSSQDFQSGLNQITISTGISTFFPQSLGRIERNENSRPVFLVVPTSESFQEATNLLNERLNRNGELD